MADKNSVILTLGYTNTDFTRQFKIDNVDAGAFSSVKDNVLAVNASLLAGTDDGLAQFFLSDDYDATDSENVIGKFNGIVDATIVEQTITPIDLT